MGIGIGAPPGVAILSAPSYALVGVSLTVSGTCAPATATVSVTVNGETLGSTVGVGGAWSVTADATYAMVGASVDVVATAGSASDTTTIEVIGPEYHWDRASETLNAVPDPDTIAALHNQGAAGTADLAQATEALQPQVGTDGDGKDFFETTASGQYLQTAADVLGGATAFTLEYIVVVPSGPTSGNLLDSNDSGNRPFVIARTASALRSVSPSGQYGDLTLTPNAEKKSVIVQWDASGAANADRLKAWLDGAPQTLAFTGTIANSALPTGTLLRVLSRYDGGNTWEGAMYSVRLWERLLTDTQIGQIYARSATDWSL